ncbi:glycosyltransferase [Mycolicibacterium sp. 3033]|nr:glycosyltransferase [Mycolicibacterium aurantiacum]
MAAIILASVPIHGHVTPLLTVAAHLVARGDHVRFITGSRFAEKVAGTGAHFVPLPAAADYDDREVTRSFPERARLKGARVIAFDIEHLFARPARSQYEVLTASLAQRPADVVVAEPAFVGAAFLLAHQRPARPAVVVCGVLPLGVESRDTAPFGMGVAPARLFNRTRNEILARLSRRILQRPQAVIDALHSDVHGVAMPGTMLDWPRRADRLLQCTAPDFEYPRSDAPENLRFTGPLTAAGAQAPLPEWWSDLDGTQPVVHVTQGTLANIDYEQLIAPTVRALAGEDVTVVVSTGGRPVDTLPPLPSNARAAEYLPYDELLPRTSVFVTNGGYGGVQCALRFGVPIVATGGKEDKPEVGARVAWSGVGRRIRSEHPSPRVLRRAILEVLRDPRFSEASGRLAAQIAASPGLDGLTAAIDELCATSGSTCAQS